MFHNALTNNEYSMGNQAQLLEQSENSGFESLKVAGYKQWQELGYQVQKGMKAATILMVVDKKYESKSGEEKKKKVPKIAKVFFFDQVQKIEAEILA